jgi:transposase
VKAYVQTNKNDRVDAAAIAEAATRPKVPAVQVKHPWQQDLQSVHRAREQIKRERVAVGNQIRGLLAEYGIVMGQGWKALRQGLPQILENADNGLSAMMRQLLASRYAHLGTLETQQAEYDRMLARAAKEHENCSALLEVPGIGVLGATALVAKVNDARHLKNGRQLAASEGLVPRHWGTGGKEWVGHLSKQCDGYIRTIFVEGARAVLRTAPRKTDRLSRWAVEVSKRRGPNIAVIALANKMARIAWVILARGQRYQSQ